MKAATVARRSSVFALALALAPFWGGCAGYHIGPAKPTPMRDVATVAVATFENATLEPRIEVLVADSLIKQLQQDGTYKVVREDAADVTVDGTITRVRRQSVRGVRANVLATREFVIVVELGYKVVNQRTGVEIFSGTVEGRTNFFVGRDLQAEERQALPLAIEEACVQLVGRLAEGW